MTILTEAERRAAAYAAGPFTADQWRAIEAAVLAKLAAQEPVINYAVIDEYVRDKGVNYNEVCRMVRAAVAAPLPAVVQVAEKERDAIAELNHQQWLALGQCAVLVSACHRLSAESEEYDFEDGLGRGAQQAYWDEFDSALERASEALDQANKETQRIHATQFAQPAQPEAAPAVVQVPPDLKERICEAHDASLDEDHRGCRAILMECVRLIDAAPEAQGERRVAPSECAGWRLVVLDTIRNADGGRSEPHHDLIWIPSGCSLAIITHVPEEKR